MKVALGFKAHSGWAALVVLGDAGGRLTLVDRRRIELVEELAGKAPYHAAEKLPVAEACALVERLVAADLRQTEAAVRAAIGEQKALGNEVLAGAVVTGAPMPAWTTEQILAVHFRMHKAEGVLFRDALCRAIEGSGVPLVAIPEKGLKLPAALDALGKAAGPPWGQDQKHAAAAALAALR